MTATTFCLCDSLSPRPKSCHLAFLPSHVHTFHPLCSRSMQNDLAHLQDCLPGPELSIGVRKAAEDILGLQRVARQAFPNAVMRYAPQPSNGGRTVPAGEGEGVKVRRLLLYNGLRKV